MSLAWAIVIVFVLFLLHRYGVLGKSLRIAAMVIAAVIVCVTAYALWDHFDSQIKEEQSKADTQRKEERSRAQFAENNECLDPATGKVHPVDKKGPFWCSPSESLQQRGTPVDQWAIATPLPTIPPGDYFAINGERGNLGESISPARLCVDSNSIQRCYVIPTKDRIFGLDSKAKVLRLSSGDRLILFSAEDYSADTDFTFVAILANRKGEIINLLPDPIYPTNYRILNLPLISPLPILVSATSDWDTSAESHADPHRYYVTSYAYDQQIGHYTKFDYFWTKRKYATPGDVLKEENKTLLAGLNAAATEESSRHVVVEDESTAATGHSQR